MTEELDALSKNHTWNLVTHSLEISVVGCKWIYKIRICPDDSIEHYKAHLVAKDFAQEYVIDYEETFTLVTRFSSVRASKWDIFQMDVKNVFLNENLSEEVYMQSFSGLSIEPKKGLSPSICFLWP